MRLQSPLTLSAMRLAQAPLKSVARKIAAESPLPQGARGSMKRALFPLSPRVLGSIIPYYGRSLMGVHKRLIMLALLEIDGHRDAS